MNLAISVFIHVLLRWENNDRSAAAVAALPSSAHEKKKWKCFFRRIPTLRRGASSVSLNKTDINCEVLNFSPSFSLCSRFWATPSFRDSSLKKCQVLTADVDAVIAAAVAKATLDLQKAMQMEEVRKGSGKVRVMILICSG